MRVGIIPYFTSNNELAQWTERSSPLNHLAKYQFFRDFFITKNSM